MNKNRISRPMRRDELAQHSEVTWFARRGKCGGCAGKQRVLTRGGPTGAIRREVSRGHSSHIKRAMSRRPCIVWAEGYGGLS